MAAHAPNVIVLQILIDQLEDENIIRQRSFLRINRRRLRDLFDPFDVSERYFLSMYRLSKAAAHMFIDSVVNFMQPAQRNTYIPPWLRVMATLNFLASGSYQRRIGQDFLQAICQTSVSVSMKEVTNVVNTHLMDTWINFPVTEEARQRLKERFMAARHFPGVIGCVDGTHIALVSLDSTREHLFHNRKGYHSKNVQIVCGADLRILAINARHGGRSHDAHVWRLSAARDEMAAHYAEGGRGTWLLGDSGYPSEPWLLRPFANHPNPNTPEGRYNSAHCSCRSTVERCIGVFKAKFRCCLKDRALHYSPEVAGQIINTCAVIHNIGIHYRVPNPHPMFDPMDLPGQRVAVLDGPGPQPHGLQVPAEGHAVRARVVRDHFTI